MAQPSFNCAQGYTSESLPVEDLMLDDEDCALEYIKHSLTGMTCVETIAVLTSEMNPDHRKRIPGSWQVQRKCGESSDKFAIQRLSDIFLKGASAVPIPWPAPDGKFTVSLEEMASICQSFQNTPKEVIASLEVYVKIIGTITVTHQIIRDLFKGYRWWVKRRAEQSRQQSRQQSQTPVNEDQELDEVAAPDPTRAEYDEIRLAVAELASGIWQVEAQARGRQEAHTGGVSTRVAHFRPPQGLRYRGAVHRSPPGRGKPQREDHDHEN
ncbi:hypothetical protein PENCOP_c004G01859 [Penicillium coprophilum]|uniref:Uncharacterized protein n=1 Tax=Penicillium coprophilum TaxID=36646 RepID=A0A1V6UV82_9EURO|nr:hypothetical protein PENCOP_c004G01859 [Penicillium coprophilum]